MVTKLVQTVKQQTKYKNKRIKGLPHMKNQRKITAIGVSLSTSTFSVGFMPEGGTIGDEIFFSTPMLGSTIWLVAMSFP